MLPAATWLGLVVSLALIGLLVAREIYGAVPGEKGRRWRAALDRAIAPLVLCFVVIVIAKIVSLA